MEILDRIKAAQRQHEWSDGEFSRRLGVSQSVWSRIQNGQRPLENWRFMSAVGRVLPELRWHIAEFLFEGGNNDDEHRANADDKETAAPAYGSGNRG